MKARTGVAGSSGSKIDGEGTRVDSYNVTSNKFAGHKGYSTRRIDSLDNYCLLHDFYGVSKGDETMRWSPPGKHSHWRIFMAERRSGGRLKNFEWFERADFGIYSSVTDTVLNGTA